MSVWQWENDSGSFEPYDVESTNTIHAAWLENEPQVHVQPACRYRIDLVARTQTCVDPRHNHAATGRERRVLGPAARSSRSSENHVKRLNVSFVCVFVFVFVRFVLCLCLCRFVSFRFVLCLYCIVIVGVG